MSIFAKLKRSDAVEQVQDTLGGFSRLESDIYDLIITMAYAVEAKSGSIGVAFQFGGPNKLEYRENIYVTSGTEKGGTHTYTNSRGETHYLPNFITVNDIAMVTTGKELFELKTEQKDIPAWDPEEKKETIQKKDVFVELLGQPVSLGILKALEDKYQEETSSVENNMIDKVFKTGEMVTVVEGEAGLEEGVFYQRWLGKNKGVTQDRRKQSKDSTGNAGAPKANAATQGTTKSLFNKKG